MKRNKQSFTIYFIVVYLIFIFVSFFLEYAPGKAIGQNFLSFFIEMVKILPCAFILIGLFEVWVKRETVEKHLGKDSGVLGYTWSLLLAATTVGGLYVAFPVAYALYSKGANIRIIFAYITASAICRIPMTIFEASFLGIKFTVIRLVVSIPLVILASIILGRYFEKQGLEIMEGK